MRELFPRPAPSQASVIAPAELLGVERIDDAACARSQIKKPETENTERRFGGRQMQQTHAGRQGLGAVREWKHHGCVEQRLFARHQRPAVRVHDARGLHVTAYLQAIW